jgi:hypothetical protein
MYTKGSFASSTAPENSHTPQQSKVGGDDEAVSTDLSASPQNGKIVQNSEQDPATHVTSSSGAADLLRSDDKDLNDVPNITDYDWELEVDPPPPAPGDSESLSTSTFHRFTAAQHEKARQVLSHHVGHTAFKPTHHDPIIAAPGACIWTEAGDIAVGGEPVFDSSFDSLCNQMYATAGNINAAEYALTDSGCGRSTIPGAGAPAAAIFWAFQIRRSRGGGASSEIASEARLWLLIAYRLDRLSLGLT